MQKHHLPRGHEVACLEAVEVDAGRKQGAVICLAIPSFAVHAGFASCIYERASLTGRLTASTVTDQTKSYAPLLTKPDPQDDFCSTTAQHPHI